MMSPVVLLTSVLTLIVEFLHVWKFDQNAITFTYGLSLRKKIYVQNQRDETNAMELVSFDSEKFYFLAFSGPEDPLGSILRTWKLLDLQKYGISW
jgi:hypothetical protein